MNGAIKKKSIQHKEKNKDQIEKKMMKLKINQNFIKRTRTKLINKKNRDLSDNTLKSQDNSEILH